ncbi:MAG: amidase domain-containing protein, partial [Acidobacteria bacterium]|nr:amidase domain-containing protein [Acidobacteriota bacterium]
MIHRNRSASLRVLFFSLVLLTAALSVAVPAAGGPGMPDPKEAPSFLEDARAARAGQAGVLLERLSVEPDPNVRRHYLADLAVVPVEESSNAARGVADLFRGEHDEAVRREMVATVMTLWEHGGLPEPDRERCLDLAAAAMAADPSWGVRLEACVRLARAGMVDLTVPRRVIEDGAPVDDAALDALAAVLHMVRTPDATALLERMARLRARPATAVRALWYLAQAGSVSPDRYLGALRGTLGAGPLDPRWVSRAVLSLQAFPQRFPDWAAEAFALRRDLRSRLADHSPEAILMDRFAEAMEGRETTLAAYDRNAAYTYASTWWNGCNHDCGSAYSDCTPWSYWGGECCGYPSQGGDCANFVSQCLLAGGHPDLSGGTPCRGYPCGREEIGAKNLGDCLVQKGWTRTCGYLQAPPANIAVGDVIVYHSGSCTDYSAHATFVMYVSGTDVRIACHSSCQWNVSYTYLSGSKPYYEWLHCNLSPAPDPVTRIAAKGTGAGSFQVKHNDNEGVTYKLKYSVNADLSGAT